MAWLKPKGNYPNGWGSIKRVIHQRANYKCELCKKPVEYSREWDANKPNHFRVHHIDQDKSNNNLTNLIYVCMFCHGELHRGLNNGLD